MKKTMIAAFAVVICLGAASVRAGGIVLDFEGKTGGAESISSLIQKSVLPQDDNFSPSAINSGEANRAVGKREILPDIKATIKWPDGKTEEGLVSCFKDSTMTSCSARPQTKGGRQDFLLEGLVRNITAQSFDKHSYDNWSGPQHFSCTDVCRDVEVLDRVETEYVKTCNGSVTVTPYYPSVGAGCTVSESKKKIYKIERQCYTHECVCVKNCY